MPGAWRPAHGGKSRPAAVRLAVAGGWVRRAPRPGCPARPSALSCPAACHGQSRPPPVMGPDPKMRLWPLALPALLAGCAGNVADYVGPRAGIVSPQLIRYGLTLDQSRCVGEKLGNG